MTTKTMQERALNEPIEDWLQLSRSVNIQIPNEIFDDLQKGDFKVWQHKAFAYTYYYINTLIYRNALYGQRGRYLYSQQVVLNKMVSSTGKFTYITKKNGVLENLGYFETIHDYPVSFDIEEDLFDFSMYSELDKSIKINSEPLKNFSVRKPTKAFVRYPEGDDFTGTFYDFNRTHRIPFKAVNTILGNNKLNYVHFYLFGYISMLAVRHKGSVQLSNQEVKDFLGCGEKFVTKVTNELEKSGLLESFRRTDSSGKMYQKVYIPITGK